MHGRYQRAGRPHKSRILDEFCLNCGYHRKAALRLLHRPPGGTVRKRSGTKIIHDPVVPLPVLKTVRVYEPVPQTPYQRLLNSPDIDETTKTRLRQEHAALDPFELKKNIERKLNNFFTVLGNRDCESTKS